MALIISFPWCGVLPHDFETAWWLPLGRDPEVALSQGQNGLYFCGFEGPRDEERLPSLVFSGEDVGPVSFDPYPSHCQFPPT